MRVPGREAAGHEEVAAEPRVERHVDAVEHLGLLAAEVVHVGHQVVGGDAELRRR